MSRSSSSCLGGLGVMAVWWKPRRIQKHSEAAQIHPIYSKYSTQNTQSAQSTQRMISGYWTPLDCCTYGFKPQALDGHLSMQFRGAWAPQMITGWQVNRVTEWRQVKRVRNVKTQTSCHVQNDWVCSNPACADLVQTYANPCLPRAELCPYSVSKDLDLCTLESHI